MDAVEPKKRQLLEAWLGMSATVLAERIGFARELTMLQARPTSPSVWAAVHLLPAHQAAW
ncbi:hypothetical protein ACFY5C_40455 [Streptomyces sp. NPDC012935]|uniref:hypothetical protein n=1 Tax=Streptomyces sp. NPDC012935 TaxID=3364857 RepID=UPI0036CC3854